MEGFHYHIGWRSAGSRPGAHPSVRSGAGLECHTLAPLLAAPDPRRYDVSATLRDPFGQLWFRVYRQRSAIPVLALVDVSASMHFEGAGSKLAAAADFVAALGYSAYRNGDPAGFFAADASLRDDLTEALRWSRAAGQRVSAGLRALGPTRRGSEGLLEAAALCARRRALVFLVSDFYVPLTLVEKLLAALAIHQVVPVVLRDRAETAWPGFGIASLRDAESGARRVLMLRRALRARLKREHQRREDSLRTVFAAAGARPLTLVDRFDAAAVTRYFLGGERPAPCTGGDAS